MAVAIILCPLVAALIAYAVPSNSWRPWLLPVGAVGHCILTYRAIAGGALIGLNGLLKLDVLGTLVLGLVSVLFLLLSIYAPGYLALRLERNNRVFCSCM